MDKYGHTSFIDPSTGYTTHDFEAIEQKIAAAEKVKEQKIKLAMQAYAAKGLPYNTEPELPTTVTLVFETKEGFRKIVEFGEGDIPTYRYTLMVAGFAVEFHKVSEYLFKEITMSPTYLPNWYGINNVIYPGATK